MLEKKLAMKVIVTPTDFSDCANSALEYAAFLTKVRNGKLYIVAVAANGDDELEKVESKLSLLKDKPFLQDISYKVIVKIGDNIAEEIQKVAEKFKADLIVMGSHGTSALGELLIGSNAEKMVRTSGFNVLTIKHKMINLKLKRIVFASDFAAESYKIFLTVKEIAEKFNAEIHLLKINTPTHFEPTRVSREKIDDFIKKQELEHLMGDKYKIAIYCDSSEELGILNYAIENDIDLISIGTHGKSLIWKLFTESTSQNLVNHSFRPVLTLKI